MHLVVRRTATALTATTATTATMPRSTPLAMIMKSAMMASTRLPPIMMFTQKRFYQEVLDKFKQPNYIATLSIDQIMDVDHKDAAVPQAELDSRVLKFLAQDNLSSEELMNVANHISYTLRHSRSPETMFEMLDLYDIHKDRMPATEALFASLIHASHTLHLNDRARQYHELAMTKLRKQESLHVHSAFLIFLTGQYNVPSIQSYREARNYVNTMELDGVRFDAICYQTVMRAAYNLSLYNDCFSLFEVLKKRHVKRDVVTYTFMLEVCTRLKAAERGFLLYEEMRKDQVVPTKQTLYWLLSCFSTSPRYYCESFRILRQTMLDHQIQPSEKLYLSLLKSTANVGDVATAEALFFAVFQRLDHEEDAKTNKLKPSLQILTHMLLTYSQFPRFKELFEQSRLPYFESLDTLEDGLLPLKPTIEGYTDKTILRNIHYMFRMGCLIVSQYQIPLRNSFLSAYVNCLGRYGELDEAVDLVLHKFSNFAVPITHFHITSLLTCMSINADDRHMPTLLRVCETLGIELSETMLHKIVNTYARTGDFEMALHYAKIIIEKFNVSHSTGALRTLIAEAQGAEEFHIQDQLFYMMKQHKVVRSVGFTKHEEVVKRHTGKALPASEEMVEHGHDFGVDKAKSSLARWVARQPAPKPKSWTMKIRRSSHKKVLKQSRGGKKKKNTMK